MTVKASSRQDPLVSRYRIKNKRISGSMHFHNEYEFYYLVAGDSTYIINGEIYSIEKEPLYLFQRAFRI